jgi:hypothetical protein
MKFSGINSPRTDPLADALRQRDVLLSSAGELPWDAWLGQWSDSMDYPPREPRFEWLNGEVVPLETDAISFRAG